MPLLTRIDRYIARMIFVPLTATFVVAAMLLMMEKMSRLLLFVIAAGGPVTVVWRMLANMVPEYASLAIPLGLLLGTLFAFRRLALSSELDSLRSVGLGYTRLLRVPYIYAVALMALNLAIVGYLQPYARYAYEQLRFDLRSGALGASIQVGEFTNLGRRMTLRVERSERQGRLLHGVFVRAETRDGKTVIATADHGTFLRTDDPETILLRLANGRLVHNSPAYEAPRVLSFKIQDLPVNLPAIEAFRRRGGSLKSEELTLPELLKLFGKHRADKQTQAAAQANFHYRLCEIVMMLLMPLLAVALAVPPKRSTSGLGIFLSIVMVVTYHKVNQYGERMAELGRLHPAFALWTPFCLFAALIVWLYWTLAYKPGGQPIGGLERVFTRASKGIARLLRLGQRRVPASVPAAAAE